MIESRCECGGAFVAGESDANQPHACAACGRAIIPVTGEPLAEGNGAGDFDGALLIRSGPDRVGEQLLLGGVMEIEIGKLPTKQIQLSGAKVSRNHCKLVRVDFGPSRWKIEDTKSTNGVIVNGDKVTSQELDHGDLLVIGDYELAYVNTERFEAPAPVATRKPKAAVPPGGPICPSCDDALAPGAKFCIPCGINIVSGRPLLTSSEANEDTFEENAKKALAVVSILVPITPMPIPIRSQAIGTTKPYVIWAIAAITVVTSILFFIAQADGESGPSKNLMLWSPNVTTADVIAKVSEEELDLTAEEIEEGFQEMPELKPAFDVKKKELKGKVPADKLDNKALMAVLADKVAAERGQFHAYQLLTHAFLHDTSGIFDFLMHLMGNLLFMLVFGSRVNSLIGNVATLVLYPLLAIAAALIYLQVEGAHAMGAMLGASGAIMGLAGMYLILFPVQSVYCAMWIRLRLWFACTIFSLRGFWILLIYFAYDILMSLLFRDGGGGVAHWAHIGGFAGGMTLALVVLFSRQFNCRGNDMLSVILGKAAWPLVGKPARWRTEVMPNVAPVPGVRAVSMNYPA